MEPSSPAKRTFHLLRPPDISSANDSRQAVRYSAVSRVEVTGAPRTRRQIRNLTKESMVCKTSHSVAAFHCIQHLREFPATVQISTFLCIFKRGMQSTF